MEKRRDNKKSKWVEWIEPYLQLTAGKAIDKIHTIKLKWVKLIAPYYYYYYLQCSSGSTCARNEFKMKKAINNRFWGKMCRYMFPFIHKAVEGEKGILRITFHCYAIHQRIRPEVKLCWQCIAWKNFQDNNYWSNNALSPHSLHPFKWIPDHWINDFIILPYSTPLSGSDFYALQVK